MRWEVGTEGLILRNIYLDGLDKMVGFRIARGGTDGQWF